MNSIVIINKWRSITLKINNTSAPHAFKALLIIRPIRYTINPTIIDTTSRERWSSCHQSLRINFQQSFFRQKMKLRSSLYATSAGKLVFYHRKTFASLKTLNQHVASKGHNPAAIVEPRVKIATQPAPFQKDHKRCFFCLKASATLQESEEHMQKAHSFFIAQR